MKLLILAALVPWLASPRAFADLVPENHDHVEHEILFEGMDRFPNLIFVLYPTEFSAPDAWTPIREGVSATWGRYVSPQVYAYPRGSEAPADEDFFKRPEVAVADLVIFCGNWVPKGSGIAHKRTIYRIVGVEGKEIRIEPGMTEQFDASGKLLKAEATPILKPRRSKPRTGSPAPMLEKVPFENSPGHFWAMGGVSVLGLLVLFKLRKSAAASKFPEA